MNKGRGVEGIERTKGEGKKDGRKEIKPDYRPFFLNTPLKQDKENVRLRFYFPTPEN